MECGQHEQASPRLTDAHRRQLDVLFVCFHLLREFVKELLGAMLAH